MGRNDGRQIKPLPSRASTEDITGWKWMFRISTNWRIGRCHISHIDMSPLQTESSTDSRGRVLEAAEHTHIVLTGTFTVLASSRPSFSPPIKFIPHIGQDLTIPIERPGKQQTVQITTLVVDQSSPVSGVTRLAVCLSNGEFGVYEVNSSNLHASSSVCKHTYAPPARSSRTVPIVQAAYHHPLFVTLSESFHLSIYDLSNGPVKLLYALSSFTSFPPSSLVLSMPEPLTYKLVLTYATPVYPAHWSIGATELVMSGAPSDPFVLTHPSSPSSTSLPFPAPLPLRLVSSRSARSFDVSAGWIDETKLRLMREQWGRKVARVAGTQTDGKWVILAPASAVPPAAAAAAPASVAIGAHTLSSHPLQLYRLYLPSLHAPPSAGPKLTFVRNLYGQIGPVAALAVADGRCVSLSVNGSVWVWDLENGTGTEVAAVQDYALVKEDGENEADRSEGVIAKGTVAFDDRRIVSAGIGAVELRRFDI